MYLLKLQSFNQLQEQHEAIKTQASKTKHTKLIIIKIQKKPDTSNNRSKWNHLKTIQKIRQIHNWEAGNQGTTGNSHRCKQPTRFNNFFVY